MSLPKRPAVPLTREQRQAVAEEIYALETPTMSPKTAGLIRAIAVRIGARGGSLDRRGDSAGHGVAVKVPITPTEQKAALADEVRDNGVSREVRERVTADMLEALRARPEYARWVHDRHIEIVILKRISDRLCGRPAIGALVNHGVIVLDCSQPKSTVVATMWHELAHALCAVARARSSIVTDAIGDEEAFALRFEDFALGVAELAPLDAQVVAAAGVS